MSEKIVKKYTLPRVGLVRIIESKGNYRIHGDYFARVEKYGVVARFSKSAEQAERSMLEDMTYFLLRENGKSQSDFLDIEKSLEEVTKRENEIIRKNLTQTPEVNSEGENK